jgi:SAM-dependent methyltransferase
MALIDALEIKRSERILDYGCAKGFLVKAFRLLGREAYGCDISRYAICTAENDIRQYLKLCTHGFPFSEMKFKYCVSKDVFEHMSVEEIKNVLFSLKNYCDNLLIIVPLGNGKTFNIPEYNYDTTHKIAQTKDWWIKLIEENGFINIWSTDKIIGIKDNWSQYANGNVFMNFKNRR